MIRGRRLVAAMLATAAFVVWTGGAAEAAECGNGPGGFEAWKQAVRAQKRRPRASALPRVGALMQANYASATIAADRSLHSFRFRSTSS